MLTRWQLEDGQRTSRKCVSMVSCQPGVDLDCLVTILALVALSIVPLVIVLHGSTQYTDDISEPHPHRDQLPVLGIPQQVQL